MEGISNGNIWGRSIPGRGNSQSGDPEAGVCGQHGSSRVGAAERGRAEVRVWVRGVARGSLATVRTSAFPLSEVESQRTLGAEKLCALTDSSFHVGNRLPDESIEAGRWLNGRLDQVHNRGGVEK